MKKHLAALLLLAAGSASATMTYVGKTTEQDRHVYGWPESAKDEFEWLTRGTHDFWIINETVRISGVAGPAWRGDRFVTVLVDTHAAKRTTIGMLVDNCKKGKGLVLRSGTYDIYHWTAAEGASDATILDTIARAACALPVSR